MTRFSLAALVLLAGSAAVPAEAPKPLTFEADVLPVLNAHCLQCHGGVHQKNGLDLRTIEAAIKGVKSGAEIVPGKPDESLLWKKIGSDEMPKTDNKVSGANKKVIRAWIEAGAKGSERKTGTAAPRPAQTPAAVAKFIDREIGTKLAAAKVPASPRADDAEFLRRVYLDVVGTPPTGERAAAFLADATPDKRAKLIDALLASSDFGKHFGERWVNLFYLTTVNQRPPDPQPSKDWFAKGLNEGRSWNQIVRDVLAATGPLADAPQGRFFYYSGDMNGGFSPKIIAGNVSQVVRGVLRCGAAVREPDRGKHGQAGTTNWGGKAAAARGTLSPEAVIRVGLPSEAQVRRRHSGATSGTEAVGSSAL